MNCEQHKKEVAGISDMKVLAEMIGDLHYETLLEFMKCLQYKLGSDAFNDFVAGRKKLSTHLELAANWMENVIEKIKLAYEISKPFMK